MERLAHMLVPWEFSPLVAFACGGALLLYAIGLARGAAPGPWRALGFMAGIILFYGVTQTRLDYYSQYLFFAHRGQHVVLHHLAPFLVALSAPAPVWAAAVAGACTPRAAGRRGAQWLARVYRALQSPHLAGGLFVGLIAFWLIPAIHFDAMLSRRIYWVMNWSMAIDGLLFWWLVFARDRRGATPHLPFGTRVLLLTLIIPPQMLIGALIAFSGRPLFEVYDICGRALPFTPIEDQQLGGLITWLPAVMMSLAGILILLVWHLREDAGTSSKRERTATEETDETAQGKTALNRYGV